MHPKSTRHPVVCARCGRVFHPKPSARQQYCSRECYFKATFGESDEARFWSKVDKRDDESCWEWQAGRFSGGYGAFTFNGKLWHANRMAWTFAHGDIPDGMLVCHRCDNPPCCNPRHLFLGTVADNTLDASRKKRLYHPSGEANGSAKLTAHDVAEIRSLYRMGRVTMAELAQMFGVSRHTIGYIVRRKRWQHIP